MFDKNVLKVSIDPFRTFRRVNVKTLKEVHCFRFTEILLGTDVHLVIIFLGFIVQMA